MKWKGAPELRELLRPVGSLRVHPENPRDHDLDVIAGSLRRFGQTKPVIFTWGAKAWAAGTLVAGNGTYLAATGKLRWTEIAAVGVEMNEAEALAYLLADNRTSDRASYHDDTLQRVLAQVQAAGGLRGTGYRSADVKGLTEKTRADAKAVLDKLPPKEPVSRSLGVSLLLQFETDDGARARNYLKMFRKEWGVSDEEIVLRLLHEGATKL